jgi:outer membrane immunogenic protein
VIRKVLLSTVALVAISGTAFAADLPSRRAPPVYIPPPIPVFTWTGFYAGGDIGYGFGKDVATSYAGARSVVYNVGRPDGVVGGGHIGYNFSTQSLLGGAASGIAGVPFVGGFGGAGGVIGIEGDITGSNYKGEVIFPGAAPFGVATRQEVAGSVRGRVGIAVDRALFFATGGVAFGQFRNTYSVIGGPATAINTDLTHDKIGWTVGGGMEYAITTNWSLRGEYRYSDFGSFTDLTAAGLGFNTRHHETVQRATVGFSYKFDNPVIAAPVVARY